MVEGGVWKAYPRRRLYAAAEGNGVGSAGSLCRTQSKVEGNSARRACSRPRNCTLAEGNRAGHAGSSRRYCAVRKCIRRRRSPWARNRDNLCCVTGQAGNNYTSILRNKRRCPRRCCRRTGRVCRTAVELSFAGAKGTWLARVPISTRVVGSSKAYSRSRSGSRRDGRRWDTTMVARRVWVTEVTVVTVYLALFLVVPSQFT